MRRMIITLRRFPFNLLPAVMLVSFLFSPLPAAAQEKNASTDAASDPILRALQAELTRSKAQLKDG